MGKGTKKVTQGKQGKGAKAGAGLGAVAEVSVAVKPTPAKPARESAADLEALKGKAKGALEGLEGARTEAGKLEEQGRVLVNAAKEVYLGALEPYRQACREVDIPCVLPGGKGAIRAPRVRFLIEKVDKGVRVTIKGQPKTEEVLPLKALRESVTRESFAYTDRWLGSRQEIGFKGAGLANRIRLVLKG